MTESVARVIGEHPLDQLVRNLLEPKTHGVGSRPQMHEGDLGYLAGRVEVHVPGDRGHHRRNAIGGPAAAASELGRSRDAVVFERLRAVIAVGEATVVEHRGHESHLGVHRTDALPPDEFGAEMPGSPQVSEEPGR